MKFHEGLFIRNTINFQLKSPVPLFTVFPDQGCLKKLVQRDTFSVSFFQCRLADVPFVVVDRLEVLVFSDADRVKMAGNGLPETDLLVEEGFFNGTIGNSFLKVREGAFPIIDQRGDIFTEHVVVEDAMFFDGFYSSLGHKRFDLIQFIFQDGDFMLLERSTRIPAHAACPLAFGYIAAEPDHVEVVRYGDIVDEDHGTIRKIEPGKGNVFSDLTGDLTGHL